MRQFLIFTTMVLCVVQGAIAKSQCEIKVDKNICINIKFKSPISRKSDSTFYIEFINDKGKSLSIKDTPNMDLWMVMKGGHGHGSEKLQISKSGKGYEVKNVWFLMLGQWKLKTNFMVKSKQFSKDIPICVRRKSDKSHVGKCY